MEAGTDVATLSFDEFARGAAGESSLLQLYTVWSWLQLVAERSSETRQKIKLLVRTYLVEASNRCYYGYKRCD